MTVMTDTRAFGHHELIETAMNRAHADTNPGADPPTDPNAIWREQQAQALKARQAQLEAARSEDERARGARLVTPVLLEPAARSRSGRWLWFVIVGLLILGAVVWWGETRPTTQATSVPQAVISQPTEMAQPSLEATPAAVSAEPPPAPVEDREALARSLVERWRQAWTTRDVETYLASYGPAFSPPKGQSRAQWEAARRDNLSSRGSIEVGINELRTEPVGAQQMAVHFLQDYTSPTYQEKAQPKTLLLEQVSGQWLIVGEWSGAFQKVSARSE
jgi:hypothetical protein